VALYPASIAQIGHLVGNTRVVKEVEADNLVK
jgi:hypothetical protein